MTRRHVPKLTLPMPQERLLAFSLALSRYHDAAEKAGATDAEAAAFAAAQSVLVLGQMAEANDGE